MHTFISKSLTHLLTFSWSGAYPDQPLYAAGYPEACEEFRFTCRQSRLWSPERGERGPRSNPCDFLKEEDALYANRAEESDTTCFLAPSGYCVCAGDPHGYRPRRLRRRTARRDRRGFEPGAH